MMEENESTKKPNRLISQKSPYLIQHAYNPVDWHFWGQEAFEKSRNEDKPIFLSIGYSTCHWCHVMEKESFEDDEVAELMNDVFVPIKVDREERPDIDGFYMTVSTELTGSGGWPLNIIMTPEKKPFFAGSYIPKRSIFGRSGMMELIPHIKDLWKNHRDELDDMGDKIISSLREVSTQRGEFEFDEQTLHNAYEQLLGIFDNTNGGFGNAPKFPTPHNLSFLLRYWKRTGNKMALQMVVVTLKAMRMGGIYDHIGFGFHRYSTDQKWLVPHFEKMLYDQALLAMAYTEAYQVTGTHEFETTAKEIITYVLRDMTGPEGGFYSAEDADSEGVEGRFYMWTEEEMQSILGENANPATTIFNVARHGYSNDLDEDTYSGSIGLENNIPHLTQSNTEMASNYGMKEDELEEYLESARAALFNVREKRVHPYKMIKY